MSSIFAGLVNYELINEYDVLVSQYIDITEKMCMFQSSFFFPFKKAGAATETVSLVIHRNRVKVHVHFTLPNPAIPIPKPEAYCVCWFGLEKICMYYML